MTTTVAATNTLAPSPFTPTMVAGREVHVADSLRLAALTESRRDITLETKEGDRVTLSLDRSILAVYGRDGRLALDRQYAEDTYGHQISHENLDCESRAWFGFASRRELRLSIEGDLSREEIRDIRTALHRIHGLMRRSFGTDVAGGAQHYGLNGLDTLAGIEVDIRNSRTTLAVRTTNISALAYGAGGQTAPVPDRTAILAQPDWQAAADEAAGIVKDSGIAPQRFADPLGNLFRQWAGEMRRHHRAHAPMVRMMANAVFEQLKIRPKAADQGWTER